MKVVKMNFLKRKGKVNTFLFSNSVNYSSDILAAKSLIPEWYKNTQKVNTKELSFDSSSPKNIKYCRPFLDAFTTGYIMVTPFDIMVKKENNITFFTWSDANVQILSVRDSKSSSLLPIPKGFSNENFIWNTTHDIKLPKGYSALFLHPLNRHDLPFVTLNAVIDGELIHTGNVPFFIKEDFEGLIPAGTPYLQIIPFKIEQWVKEKNENLFSEARLQSLWASSFLYGWYVNYKWSRKRFE
jgi:hypothetical protein